MKIIIVIFTVVVLSLFGCQDENLLVEPINISSYHKLSKIESYDSETTSVPNKLKIIRTKSFTVDGSKGGLIFLKYIWKKGIYAGIKVEAKLKIPIGAFKDSLTFDIIINPKLLSIQLCPSPFTFDKPVLLDLKYKGIDFSNIDPSNLDFKYISPSGHYVKTEYDYIKIDPIEKVLFVHNAVLPHFSRYGWTR